jgi:PhnB protein
MVGKPTRPGFHTITPYLIVADVDAELAFMRRAFGATETFRTTGNAGGTHVEVKIGDSMVMIGGGGGESVPSMVFLYVEDVDAVYRDALDAGATSLMEPVDQDFNDRMGGVEDAMGIQWYMATHAIR